MTCIISWVDKKKGIVMAGDKLGSNGWTGGRVKDPKVFYCGDDDEFMVGYCGSFRMGQLLKNVWEPPPRIVGDTTDKYIYISVVDSIKQLFEENNFGTKDKGGTFILGYEGRVFRVQDDFSFLEHETGIESVGSGFAHAEAALAVLLHYEKDVETIIKKTYEIVGGCVVSVSKEFDYITEKK